MDTLNRNTFELIRCIIRTLRRIQAFHSFKPKDVWRSTARQTAMVTNEKLNSLLTIYGIYKLAAENRGYRLRRERENREREKS